MRGPVTMVGPVAHDITTQYHLTPTLYGYLTSLPLWAFGLFSFSATYWAQRLSLKGALLLAALGVALGCSLRVVESHYTLYVGTLLVGAGIALLNVLVPVSIRAAWPQRVGFFMGIYTMTIVVSAGVGSLTAVPLLSVTTAANGPFVAWAVVAWVSVLLALFAFQSLQSDVRHASFTPLLRNKVAWALTFVIGLQSLMMYTVAAWAPSYWMTQGIEKATAGTWLFIYSMACLPSAFLCSTYLKWCKKETVAALGLALLYASGIVAWWVGTPTAMLAGCVLAGLAQGATLPTALIMMAQKSQSPDEMLAVSSMGQGIGYLVAGLGPLIFGFIQTQTGSWSLAFAFLIGVLVLWTVAAFVAAAHTTLTPKRKP